MNNLKVVIFWLPIFLSGCVIYNAPGPATDYYYLNPNKDLYTLGRVALIELNNDSTYPRITTDVTESLFEALQKKQLFGLTVVHQDEPALRGLPRDPDSTYTLKQLSAMRKALNCDAVLIGTITGFRPYPHMAIGLRLKLVDLADAQLLWALEQVWDTADKTTEQRIEKYFKRQMHSDYAPLRKKLVIVSSLKFVKFVAFEVAETLKPKE